MLQDAANENESIANASLLQGFLQRSGSIARAEALILDMRMRHQVIACGRVRLQSHHIEATGLALVRQRGPGQLDRERAQFHISQGNGLGGAAKELLFHIDVLSAALLLQSFYLSHVNSLAPPT